MKRTREAHRPAARKQRKTLDVDQQLLDRARAALGASTETEAVRLALQKVLVNHRIAEGLRGLAGLRFNRQRVEE